jgi:hypothetical protein
VPGKRNELGRGRQALNLAHEPETGERARLPVRSQGQRHVHDNRTGNFAGQEATVDGFERRLTVIDTFNLRSCRFEHLFDSEREIIIDDENLPTVAPRTTNQRREARKCT